MYKLIILELRDFMRVCALLLSTASLVSRLINEQQLKLASLKTVARKKTRAITTIID